jgi:hypothetical protein
VGDACEKYPGTPPGEPVGAAGCPILPADFGNDSDVDQADFGHLQVCLKGINVSQHEPACRYAELNADGNIAQTDVSIFLQGRSGSGIPADLQCAD